MDGSPATVSIGNSDWAVRTRSGFNIGMTQAMHLQAYSKRQLLTWSRELEQRYRDFQASGLALDLTRGKPSIEQLELSASLDGILGGDFRLADGSDARGYGGLDGIPQARTLAAEWLGVSAEEALVGGNSSLMLMHAFMLCAHFLGLGNTQSAWCRNPGGAKFLCPVPGYDRHFAICEELGIDMLPVPLGDDGPDMDVVEAQVAADAAIKGIWCVPKFSNPSGAVYSHAVVERMARLPQKAGDGFFIFWDNAYAVHELGSAPIPLTNLMDECRRRGTQDRVVIFGSTSKVTFAGAGLAFMGASVATLNAFRRHLSVATIGPDKVNQLRHVRFLPDMAAVRELMARHAALLRPKFQCVQQRLRDGLEDRGMGTWTDPAGGYFVSFDALPGLATAIIARAANAGVKLTPAGAAFPYGRDPEDRNIRLAPSYPPLDDVDRAMQVFVNCVQLCSVEKRLTELGADAGSHG
jgi:DNA-binding transcriptional MocR family regulator